jgi:hypothetical protein
MGEAKKYAGGCHCKKVRYEVTADLSNVITCNCSMCSKKGSALTFVPAAQFTLLSGGDGLTDYQFNTMNIHHLFCSTCGVTSFARGTSRDGSAMVAINARCLDDVDYATLNVKMVDGKSL